MDISAKIKSRKKWEVLLLIVALLVLGIRYWFYFQQPPPILAEQDSYIGIIDDDPQDKGLWQSFPVTIVGASEDKIRVLVQTARYPKYAYGDEIEISGKALFKPRSFKSENGQVFDYEHFLAKDDIYFQVKNPTIQVIAHNRGNPVVAKLIHIKHQFLSHIKAVLGEPQTSLAGGLVVGEKSALGKDLIDDFRRAGLIHIVVLSGYNITIVAVAIRRMLSFLPRSSAIIIGGIAMILFCILVGGGATVVRSCIMAMIGLVGELAYRQYQVGRALGIAAYLMIFQNPSILIHDPSFQLSFLATLALVLLASPLEGLLERIHIPEFAGLRGLIATTFATQIFVSPFIFYLMGQISVIGVIVNILVLPMIPATMFVVTAIGLGGYLWGWIGYWVAFLFAIPTYALLSYELWVVRVSAHLPGAVFTVSSFSFATMCAVYAVYAGLF
ncbi:MAG: hypothetical protein RIT04_470, partial [Candidatus Parcubacteria bacterium]